MRENELEGLARSVVGQFEEYVRLNKKIPPEVQVSLSQIEDPSKLADTIASHLTLKVADKQELLEVVSTNERFERIYALMESEIGALQVEKKIRGRVKRQMEKTQREYYLNEQLKAIQKELVESEDGRDELAELEETIKKTKLSKEARDKATNEFKKLRNMGPMSAEATVVRNYLDWLLGIPWGKRTRIKKDIARAEQILDEDHYGLEKVKERILEYLAVQQRTKRGKGPIFCLVGAPGVGKTSLGRSIARATGRNFIRASLGGVHDEAEIRGHRRTYIGSLPGKIIQQMKKEKTVNPLFLLDEVDKLGADFRGDPSSALLEALDPEQNVAFNDHYLEVDYDLSEVMFITTANTLRIPPPLLDRMEIIRLAGYTEDEKVEIAKRHLIKKQMAAHALKSEEWSISDDALRDLIRYYTREAGVRNLERELANLTRKTTRDIVKGPDREGQSHAPQSEAVRRRAALPLRRGRDGGSGGRDHRPGLDRGGRRALVDRGREGARQGQDDDHRQPRRCDEGIGAGGSQLRARQGGQFRSQADQFREGRHPHPRARGRDPQGWPISRGGDDHLDRLDAHQQSGAPRCRDDGRDHAAGSDLADQRAQGEAAGGAARRHPDRHHPDGERKGSGPRSRTTSSAGSRSSPPSTSTRCWPVRWSSRWCRSNGRRRSESRKARPSPRKRAATASLPTNLANSPSDCDLT